MVKRIFKFFSMVTLITAFSIGTTWAQGWDRHRTGGGELDRYERQILRHERHQIRQFENHAVADGRVSRYERRHLENMHDRLDRNRHHFRHNDNRRYDCQIGCRHRHVHRWPKYHHYPEYRPHGYYPDHDRYRFSGAWLQPGGFFSISIGGN